MWKAVLAGSTALMIAGSSFVYAQQQPGPRADGPRWRPGAEDFAAFTDARVAGLKAGLKLTPEQEKNWPAVEAAIRDVAKQRAERFQQRADEPRGPRADADPIARLRQRADRMTDGAATLKKLADASEPLYKSLDEGQKRRFVVLARMQGRAMMGHRGPHHRGPHAGPMHDGPMHDGPGPHRGPGPDGPGGPRPL